MPQLSITNDLEYLAVFALVLILPKIFLRLKIPSGITALLLGVAVVYIDPALPKDQLFRFLAQIGITSLFVFSGLEVDFEELKQDRVYLSKYVGKFMIMLAIITFGLKLYFNFNIPNSLILALGIFTPSAGFIINSLHSFKIGEDLEYWVKSKAISKEVISIFLLFIAIQSGDLNSLLITSAFIIGLIIVLPMIFRLFFRFVSPYAPNSEVPFLVVLSLVAGVISKELGAYYLIGAFIVGLTGARFKKDIFKDDQEGIFTALSSFFNVFLPFYFFYAGMKLKISGLSWDALLIGLSFVIIFIPLRFFSINTSIRYMLKEFIRVPYAISLSLMPTLIFGLIIAGILLERGDVPTEVVYALVIYTLISSLLPTILFAFEKLKPKSQAEGE